MFLLKPVLASFNFLFFRQQRERQQRSVERGRGRQQRISTLKLSRAKAALSRKKQQKVQITKERRKEKLLYRKKLNCEQSYVKRTINVVSVASKLRFFVSFCCILINLGRKRDSLLPIKCVFLPVLLESAEEMDKSKNTAFAFDSTKEC